MTAHLQGQAPVYASGAWEIDLARRELRLRGNAVPLGGRAFDIVASLVRSAGDLVTKEELMARVWPGYIVGESTLHVHISVIRKALGPDRGILKTASGRGYRLLGDWTVRAQSPTKASIEPQPAGVRDERFVTNLPVRISELIGRTAEIQRLSDLVSACRIVTLTGPGGIGKTALALDVARSVFSRDEGDVLLVELASLSDPGLVPSAVASVLGLRLGSSEISSESVARAIGDKKILLVLDNCEHVVDAAATMAETLVRSCSQVTVLATGREALRIEGEGVYRVPPLDVPREHEEHSGTVLEHSAVQLFVARTAALRSAFSPNEENLASTATICRHLDGIPLAIEFAAARAATLGVRQVASRLDDRFRLLTGGRRTALPQHQTLRATLDWSYGLLAETEQIVLRRLAVFVGSFTLDAAGAVAGDDAMPSSDVVDQVSNLVAKSLISADVGGEEPRYRLLETTRAYALERLGESGEADSTVRRHAIYHRDLLGRAENPSGTMSTVEWLARYAPSLDDIRAALRWAFAPGGDPSIGLALTTATVPLLWLQLSLLGESRAWVEQALAALDADAKGTQHEMLLQTALGLTEEHIKGPVSTVRAVWERVLELAVGLDEIEYQLRAHYGLWLHSMQTRDYRDALARARDFSRVAEHKMARTDILIGDRLIGTAQIYLGDHADARVHLQRVCDHYVRLPDRSHAVRYGLDQRVGALMHLARNLWFQGFPDQAVSTVRATVEEAGVAAHEMSLLYTLVDAACPISAWIGDVLAVERYGAMLIDLAEKRSLGVWRACGMAWQTWASAKHKHAEAAAPALGEALRTLREVRFFTYYTIYLGWLGETVAAAEQIDESLSVTEGALRDSNEAWCFPEFQRVKGELLLLRDATNGAAAEDNFQQALDLARRQGALSWELRAAMSLARLQRGQGRTAEALAQLAPVYERFSEGLGTADLRAAKALIDELRK